MGEIQVSMDTYVRRYEKTPDPLDLQSTAKIRSSHLMSSRDLSTLFPSSHSNLTAKFIWQNHCAVLQQCVQSRRPSSSLALRRSSSNIFYLLPTLSLVNLPVVYSDWAFLPQNLRSSLSTEYFFLDFDILPLGSVETLFLHIGLPLCRFQRRFVNIHSFMYVIFISWDPSLLPYG